jgi:hypothetical protein
MLYVSTSGKGSYAKQVFVREETTQTDWTNIILNHSIIAVASFIYIRGFQDTDRGGYVHRQPIYIYAHIFFERC